MNLLEAIQGAGEKNWFRPVRLMLTGFAYSHDGQTTFMNHADPNFPLLYPEKEGHMTCNLKDLTGEWEIVTPEQVLSERKL